MTRPLVSICVPTCNRSALLRESLASIRRQDYPNLEILISDNHSADETEQICRTAAAADPRVRYVRQPRNIGMHANHNFLIEESRGDFLAFFHDDDIYQPHIVSTYVDFLASRPAVGLVCSDWGLIDETGRSIGVRRHTALPVTPGYDYIDQTVRSGQSLLGCPGTMIRRSALGDVRFDQDGPVGFGDFAVWFEVAEGADVGHVDGVLWDYRLHTRAFSRRTITSVARDYALAIETYCDRHLRRHQARRARVERWRRCARGFLFWALAYEIGLAFRRPESSARMDGRYRTVFELADYRLDPQELAAALVQLREYRAGALQTLAQQTIALLVWARFTQPLEWAARYPMLMRRLLGIR